MTVYGYGQRRCAFVGATQGMRALLAARPREQRGEQLQKPSLKERDQVRVARIDRENKAVAKKRREQRR